MSERPHAHAGKFMGRPLVPLIVVADSECGAAMAVLPPAQRAFVIAKVHHGSNNTEAARRAGYSNTGESAKVVGYRLAHTPAIVAAIIEESKKVLKSEGPNSIKTLVTIRDNPKAENKDRIKAAIELLNRGGLNAVSESHLTVEHKLSEEQLDRRILELCRELSLDEATARKMLIAPDAIEGEFEEVAPATVEDPEHRAALDRENDLRRLRESMTPEQLATHKQQVRQQRRDDARARYAAAQGEQPANDLADVFAPIMPGEFNTTGDYIEQV